MAGPRVRPDGRLLARPVALGVGADDDTLVRDVDQPAATDGLDEFAGKSAADRVLEAADADGAVLVDPAADAERGLDDSRLDQCRRL